jgi:inhibitor of the pro-sigma K processing machinery
LFNTLENDSYIIPENGGKINTSLCGSGLRRGVFFLCVQLRIRTGHIYDKAGRRSPARPQRSRQEVRLRRLTNRPFGCISISDGIFDIIRGAVSLSRLPLRPLHSMNQSGKDKLENVSNSGGIALEIVSSLVMLAAVVVGVIALIRILAAPIKKLLKLVLNAIIGLVLLWLVNFFGDFVGIRIELNWLTLLISALFGAPGIVLMVVYQILF